jgi:uncharacterized protein
VVAWQPWGDGAFARARASGRPVLLSLSASWCGACHRMDEETWDDPGVAAVVERTTVPVRVDADERPDLYGRYHLGGLPSTAVLSPEGDFIRGGTFLSPTQLLGLLESARADLRQGRRPSPRARAAAAPAAPLVTEMVARLRRRADREHGGFGAGEKLPEPESVTLLLREWRRRGDAELAAIARASLDAIATHLVDPTDGGFFRYAAAADWSGPHTEKVTVDQAALILLFLEASVALEAAAYRRVALRALEHARTRLADAEGRAYASVAAAPRDDVDRRRFADAGAALVRAGLLARALTGMEAGFTLEAPTAAPDGAVPHWLDAPDGVMTPRGLLRDQALSMTAAVEAHRVGGDGALLEWAARAASWSLAHLWDESRAAFRDAPSEGPIFTPLVANGEMAQALLALAVASGDARWRRLAAQVVQSLGAEAARSPAGAALALAAQLLDRDAPATT